MSVSITCINVVSRISSTDFGGNLPDCSIIGGVQSVALTDAVKSKVHHTCGVWVDHASQFFRAMIRQRVFYSKSYTRLKSHNSYSYSMLQ